MSASVQSAIIEKITRGTKEEHSDLVAVEEPLEIRLGYGPDNQREQATISVTMRTPGHDFELALGFLFTEGIIESPGQVSSVKYCIDNGRQSTENIVRVELNPGVKVQPERWLRNFYTTSSCGVCGKASIDAVKVNWTPLTDHTEIETVVLLGLADQLREKQLVFSHTGGLHAVGLFDAHGQLIQLREDVGRHNAMDKVLGSMFMLNAMPLSSKVLVVSGRASFELVQKAAVAGAPVLAAVGAPSSLAIELARASGMTLAGFLREGRFNIYTHAFRVIE